MCGIAGIVGLPEKDLAAEKIRLMTSAIAHRGPDAEGFFVDDGVALGHRRLSIIDLSDAANQPMFDATGRYAIILNGEIYNYREVRANFPDYPFRTLSDTEVILAAYSSLGADCLALLNGMFALAIWDKKKRELFVARDRLGVKPLYYAQTPGGALVFASEMRAILQTALVPREINKDGLYDYLLYQSVYAPHTIVEGIYQLPAGEFGVFAESDFKRKPYWNIDDRQPAADIGDPDLVKKHLRQLLLSAVERRMISDVRLGAFLSGGIDSSAVVALMSQVSQQPVDTFSVTFGEIDLDESRYSDLIAQKFNTRHTRIKLTPDDLLANLPHALKAADSPSGDGINTYVISKATKRAGITVALSGIGGDEIFAGYPNFFQWMKTQSGILSRMPKVLRKSAAVALAGSRDSKHQRMAAVLGAEELDLASFYSVSRQVMSEPSASQIYRNGHRRLNIKQILYDKRRSIEKFPRLSQFSIAELLGYTQNVLLKDTDQFSMASALEVREPLLDYKLVEYVLQIPDEIKYPRYPKSLFVEAISPLLPDEIVHRKKMGFVFPWEQWMRNELKEFCDARITSLCDRGIFDSTDLRSRWRSFQNGSGGVKWSQVWHLVVLADWLENNKF